MELNEIDKKYGFTTKIELDEENYIELREPTMMELKDFSDSSDKKNMEILTKLFPKCMIDHSFTDNGEKADNEKVANHLIASGSTYNNIIDTWMESIPFKKKNEEK